VEFILRQDGRGVILRIATYAPLHQVTGSGSRNECITDLSLPDRMERLSSDCPYPPPQNREGRVDVTPPPSGWAELAVAGDGPLRSDVERESRQKERKRKCQRDGRCIVAGSVIVGIAGSPVVSVPSAVTVAPVPTVISMTIAAMAVVRSMTIATMAAIGVVVAVVVRTAVAAMLLPGI
jgi:hypothetical protein